MTSVTALIVDDEPLARKRLRELIRDVAWIECLGEAADGPAALRAIDELQPDLAFLDIRLPGLSGLDLLRRVRHVPAVIFTTAYDRHAVTAFELAALDYLLKPFSRDRFLRAMERARPLLDQRMGAAALERVDDALARGVPRRLFVRDGGRVVPLPVHRVGRLEACDDFVQVFAGGCCYRINVTLQDLEQRLDATRFVRVHRSHLVNLDHVASWAPYDGSRFQIQMRDGTTIAASRQRSRVLRGVAR